MLRVARDVVGEREADDERRERPDDGELEGREEDVAVDVELADDVVPQVAVVVERPRVRDVGEADDRAEARRDDEPERDEEEEDVPRDGRKNEPTRIARSARTGAGLPAPVLTLRTIPTYEALNSVQMRSRSRFPFALTWFVSSFFTVAGGGKTTLSDSSLPADVPLSSDRLSGDP